MLPKPLKYAAIAGSVGLFGIIFGWAMFPAILKSQLKKVSRLMKSLVHNIVLDTVFVVQHFSGFQQTSNKENLNSVEEMALSKKTDVRQMWETIPFAIDFKIFFFNYTNVEEIQNGAVPIVKEVGPYYFELWKSKVEIEDHEENDTITYKKKDRYLFKPELCGPGLTGEETIVMPHPLLLSTIIATRDSNPAMLSMVGKAINGIFDNPPDVFLRAKPLDILFRGIMINCARTEFAPKAVCTAYKKESDNSAFQIEPNNQFRFSFFGKRNDSVDRHVITVKRGIKNIMDVGAVVAIDGKPSMKIWRDACNNYSGTDNTVFPPFLTEKDRLEAFSTDLCRSFKPWYQRKSSYNGIKTNRYTVNIGDFANDPEQICYCDTPNKCPPKGMMNLMKCFKAPMFASLPHFLDCDPGMLNGVKGLNPNINEHGMEIDFEPISGTPMSARQRLQFNIQLIQTEKLNLCKDLPNTFAPLFWVEEGIALNKTFVKMLKMQLFIPKRVVGVIRWMLTSFGIIGAIVGIVFHFKDDIMRIAASQENNKVTAVKPEEEGKDISVIGQNQVPSKIDM